jgi:hypothetical protein
LYVFTLAPSLLNDDPAEYQTLLPVLGIAHPTGYPLYTLLGYGFTRLMPLGDMAFRVNLFSAVAGASAIALFYRLLRALDIFMLGALAAAFALAVATDTWTYATIAQTYALNTLLMVAALHALVNVQQRHDRRSLLLFAFSVGLGIAHHSTFWLLAPALAAVLLLDPELRRLCLTRTGLPAIASAAIALAIPLVLYAYVPLRGEQLLASLPGDVLGVPRAVATGLLTPHYLAGWTNVVVGSFYAGSTLGGAPVDWGKGLGEYLGQLNGQFHGFEILALGLLAPAVWRRNRPLVLVLVTAWLTNVIVVLRGVSAFNEPAGGLYTPTYLVCALVMALVLDTFAKSRLPRLPALLPAALSAGVLPAVALWSLMQNFSGHDLRTAAGSGQLAFHEWATNQLAGSSLPRDAVILGAWSEVTPLHYVQIIENVRPDVAVIQAPLPAPAGRELIARALDEGRMPYLAASQGSLVAVAFQEAFHPGHVLQALFGAELDLLGYDIVSALRAGVEGRQAEAFSLRLYWRAERKPAADYKVFVHLLDAGGNQIATADHPPVTQYFPTSNWRQGLFYLDAQPLPDVSDFRAIEIGLYDSVTLKRLSLPDGQTSIRIERP